MRSTSASGRRFDRHAALPVAALREQLADGVAVLPIAREASDKALRQLKLLRDLAKRFNDDNNGGYELTDSGRLALNGRGSEHE